MTKCRATRSRDLFHKLTVSQALSNVPSYHATSQQLVPVPLLRHTNPVHTLSCHFFKVYFSIYLPSALTTLQNAYTSASPITTLHIFLISQMSHSTHPPITSSLPALSVCVLPWICWTTSTCMTSSPSTYLSNSSSCFMPCNTATR
jgi:hypothetical protein